MTCYGDHLLTKSVSQFLGLVLVIYRCGILVVGWIVGSARFTISVLSVFAILTHPPISVVGNNIWYGCSLPVIKFLVILFPSGVVISLYYSSIFPMQVRKYIDVPTLIVFLVFIQLFCSRQLFCLRFSILLLAFFFIVSLASTVLLAFMLLFSSISLKVTWRRSWQSSSLPFFSYVGLYYHYWR